MDCIFCNIIAGAIPSHKIYEDEHTLAFLNIAPVSEGHTLVIPKHHAAVLAEGAKEDAARIMETVYAIAPSVMRGVSADGYNLGMNHGECAGQEVMHTHVHIMPRKNGEPRTYERMHPSQDELKTVADKIRAVM